jgi:hypothetical protein
MASSARLLTMAGGLMFVAGCGADVPSQSNPAAAPPGAASSTSPDQPDEPLATADPPAAAPPASVIAPTTPTEVETPAASAPAAELLRETFADAAGAIHWDRDGGKSAEGPVSKWTVYFFHGMPEGGPLVMKITEDHSLSGPDSTPGVLALSWQELPPKLPYSGFTFLGGREAERRLILPPLKEARTIDDLKRFRLSFRFQTINAQREGPFQLTFNCRLEPLLADSYRKRLDLGTLAATGDWGTFEMGLDQGTNAEAFFLALADESPPAFKIIWAQTGPLASYRSGDTLLIDDIVISQQPPP